MERLGEIADVRDGTHDSPKYYDEGVPFVTSKNLTDSKLNFSNIKYISKEDHTTFSKRSHVENGDILFGMIGTIGSPVIVNESFEFSIKNVALIKFSKNTRLNNVFTLNVLKSHVILNQFKKIKNGGVLNFIGLGNIRGLYIPVPPLIEQIKIAEILAAFDDKIEIVEEQINETVKLKNGLVNHLLTKGIGHTKFKDSSLGVIPENWEIACLKDFGEFKNGINKSKEEFGHGFPFVNLMNVFGVNVVKPDNLSLVNTSQKELEDYDLRKGDVLFIRSSVKPSGVGLTAVVSEDIPNTVYSGFLIRFRDNGKLIMSYKKHCFYEIDFRNRIINLSSVSANTNINQNSLEKLEIKIPPKKEQELIANILDTVDEKSYILNKKRLCMLDFRKGLMQKLLTGKLRIRIN